jgi:hypothetical protein
MDEERKNQKVVSRAAASEILRLLDWVRDGNLKGRLGKF